MKFSDILINKRKLCDENISNFIDLIDNFIKSKNIILKEKVWNLFKNNLESKNEEFILIDDVFNILKENCKNVFLFFNKFR